MKALHLKSRNGLWYYQRRRPKQFEDIEPRLLIRFALKTRDFSEAKLKAAQISVDLEKQWQDARARSVSLKCGNDSQCYAAAS